MFLFMLYLHTWTDGSMPPEVGNASKTKGTVECRSSSILYIWNAIESNSSRQYNTHYRTLDYHTVGTGVTHLEKMVVKYR